MLVEEELSRYTPEKDMLLTMGVFDGVHLGHKHLISQLKKKAAKRGLLAGVVTFRQHPLEVLAPGTQMPYLTSLEEKLALLGQEGVDAVIPLTFTPELAGLGAEEFVSLLQRHLRMKGLVIGPDFALGRDREGDVEALRRLGKRMGFDVTVTEPAKIEGNVVSSTSIRRELAAGNIRKVVGLIGRSFSLEGQVVAGDARGREMGFPTANLEINPGQTLPADGIYATIAHVDGQAYKSVTNIGKRPTFGENERTVETYIMDFSGDLYGRRIKLEIIERLRGEKKFDSVAELERQMAEDVRRSLEVLDSPPGK